RHFYSEARAEWVIRAARYRAGERLRPDLELLRAVERVGAPVLYALVCLNEAAVALRAGDATTTRDLAAAAHRAWRELDRKWGALLAQSLAIRAGAATNKKEILGLSEVAIGCPTQGIGIQVLGLLAAVESEVGPRFADAIPALLAPISPNHRGLRMDVLSA